MCTAESWVVHTDKSPAFTLARAGYDVWLGNSRGTKHSRNHQYWDPNEDYEYWQFSWEQMAVYDLPKAIDYVREQTGREKISYVGHSQGTSQMFAALGMDQDFWKKRVNLFVALAPALVPKTDSALFKSAAILETILEKRLASAKIYELYGQDWIRYEKTVRALIPTFDFDLTQVSGSTEDDGDDKEFNDPEQALIFSAHFPAGSSVRCLVHFGQLINAKKF